MNELKNTTSKHPFVYKNRIVIDGIKINAEIAKIILTAYNPKNRTPSNPAIRKYTNDMKNGNWDKEGINILAFDVNGNLLDGQQRLISLVDADVILPFTIFAGLPEKARAHIDSNLARTPSVRYCLSVHKGEVNKDVLKFYQRVISVANVMMWVDSRYQKSKFTVSELASFLDINMDNIKAVCHTKKKKGLTRAAFLAACATYYKKFPDQALDFFIRVTGEGAGLVVDSPELKIRNYLIEESQNGGQARQKEDYQKSLWAINRFHLKESCPKLRAAYVAEF